MSSRMKHLITNPKNSFYNSRASSWRVRVEHTQEDSVCIFTLNDCGCCCCWKKGFSLSLGSSSFSWNVLKRSFYVKNVPWNINLNAIHFQYLYILCLWHVCRFCIFLITGNSLLRDPVLVFLLMKLHWIYLNVKVIYIITLRIYSRMIKLNKNIQHDKKFASVITTIVNKIFTSGIPKIYLHF